MARPSPGAQRVVALLNFFADHPGQSFSLTDLIRALKINRATCHSLLGELVQASYLHRTNDKRYVLGAAIARLTRAASLHLSPLEVALPEMRALADSLDVVCMALFHEHGDVVAREYTTSVSHLAQGGVFFRGARWPLRPPNSAIFLASRSDAEVDGWLDSLAVPPSLKERRGTKATVAFVREHGIQFMVRAPSEQDMANTGEWLFLPDPAQRPLQPGASLEPAQSYCLASMAAPVFDLQRRVAFVLELTGFSGVRTGAQIGEIAAQLRAACARITDFFVETPSKLAS